MIRIGPLADRSEPAADPVPAGVASVPSWFWLLPVLVLAAWWPIAPYWASDDYFALHYARDFGNVLHDFAGPQYGAADLLLFYRPLITLSLWLEQQFVGSAPFLAHLDNVLLHAANALLVGLLWRRLLDDVPAFGAGLLWALSPMHIGAIGWAVGRTDGTSTLFALLSVLLLLRWCEGTQRTRVPSLLAMGLGLLCKETALCVPGLVAVAAFGFAPLRAGTDVAGFRARVGAAARATWPYAALLAVYLGWRIAILGRLGGYDAAAHAPLAMLQGLGTYVLDLTDPLHWCTPRDLLPAQPDLSSWLPWLGLLPAAIAVLRSVRRGRGAPALLCLGWFLLATVPLAGFLAQADNHHNLRYFALAFAGLAGLLAAQGLPAIAIGLLVFAPALVQVRVDQWRADRTSAAMHQKLLRQLADGDTPGPWFVAGLPHQDPTGTALQFHFGIDRMLEPPFGPGGVQVYAHRPIFALPGAVRLIDGDDLPIAPPAGTTLLFRGPELLTTVPQRPLPALPLTAPAEVLDLTVPRLYELNSGTLVLRLGAPGLRPQVWRLVIFTATGYLGALAPDHAAPEATDGMLDLLRFFQQAQWSEQRQLIDGLTLPVILDESTEFPVMVEVGELRGGAFAPTHRARRLLRFKFDRELPALLRRRS